MPKSIVIDDGSQDKTAERAAQAGAAVYCHPYNIGNGAAIKSGIRVAGGDIMVFMDADGRRNQLRNCWPVSQIMTWSSVPGR